jgi:hypothetical protein
LLSEHAKQVPRNSLSSILRTSIDQIANFVYAEKQKCQSTLTNRSHVDRR